MNIPDCVPDRLTDQDVPNVPSYQALNQMIKKAHSDENKRAWHAYIIYGDGEITSQKGNDLMWQRSEFTKEAPICDSQVFKMTETCGKSTYAIVSLGDGLKIRDLMKRLYFGSCETKEPNSIERMLGASVELVTTHSAEKVVEILSK